MFKHFQERRQSETGFTLIELMVVVLIMGILMAIAIPTFLSTVGSSKDAAAKSNATNVFTNEKAYFESNQAFLGAGNTSGSSGGKTLDPNLPWGPYAALVKADEGDVVGLVWSDNKFVNAGSDNKAVDAQTPPVATTVLLVESLSSTGTCYYIFDDETNFSNPVIGYAVSNANAGSCTNPASGTPLTMGTGTASGNPETGAITTVYPSW